VPEPASGIFCGDRVEGCESVCGFRLEPLFLRLGVLDQVKLGLGMDNVRPHFERDCHIRGSCGHCQVWGIRKQSFIRPDLDQDGREPREIYI
jgi:hypothetical protein